MLDAPVGDDVFGEDPTINRLQDRIADMAGTEAALFVTSGTQGNQVSINAHTRPGQEVLLNRESHIVNYESGSPAMLAGVQLNGLDGHNGVLTAAQIEAAIRPSDDHYPQSGLVCIENTHNRAGGTIFPLAEMERVAETARRHGLPVHLDGARLWNAMVATGISLKDYCRLVDSASLCFSKGLGAPVGSIVVGRRDFIQRAHFYRKAYGGGIRQGGILAAAALYALDHHLPLLERDHARARRLADAINTMPALSVDMATVETNMVIFDVDPDRIAAADLAGRFEAAGVRMFAFGPTRIRAVMHLDLSDSDVEHAIAVMRSVMEALPDRATS